MINREKNLVSSSRADWRKLMLILLFGNIAAGIAFSEVMPFLPFFLRSLGHYSTKQLNLYTALIFSSTYFVAAFLSPIWGKIGDRYGRKPILVLSTLGAAFVLGALSFVTNAAELIALRFLQGVFAGYFTNTNALLAAEVPKEKSGNALGTLSTGFITGSLLGPTLGGIVSSLLNYRATFLITGFLLIIVFFINLFFVHESHGSSSDSASTGEKKQSSEYKKQAIIYCLFLNTLLIQMANNSIRPIQSFYVAHLMHHTGNVNLMNGLAVSAPGIVCLTTSSFLGKLGDRIGTEKILKAGLFMAILILIPMAFVTNVYQFISLQLLMGFSDAALIPAVSILLAKFTAVSHSSSTFSWNQSFQSAGIVIGPFIGSLVANLFGYQAIFLMGASLLFLLLVVNQMMSR
ncbi:MFS transporter [Sporolactobacillus shoreae]|uniref:MFS transporter n=1 Tax=Sporolactobacillus shoreae TaxID=1465501 RepID=A0A4Z0GQA8_9BACL|nr:MFS transporter [Sporolactobacillus shoreae]TGA98277.1 MFS transporter [Sporolactobacillus shoreae]